MARPHVGAGVTKAALDAACLADALVTNGTIEAALASYDRERQRAGEWAVSRSGEFGACVSAEVSRGGMSAALQAERSERVFRESYAAPRGARVGEAVAAGMIPTSGSLQDHAQAGSDLVHLRVLDHPAPFRDFGRDVGAELGRCDAGRLEAEREHLFLHVRQSRELRRSPAAAG